MSNSRHDLISTLSQDLQPVKPVTASSPLAALWIGCVLLTASALIAWTEPFSPLDASVNGSHLFVWEILAGGLALVSLAVYVFSRAIPGHPWRYRSGLTAVSTGGLWVATIVGNTLMSGDLHTSSHAVTEMNHRAHCSTEIMIYGALGLTAGLLLQQKLYPLDTWQGGALVGLTSGLAVAWIMQLACIHTVDHSAINHFLPALIVSPLGALLGYLMQRRRLQQSSL